MDTPILAISKHNTTGLYHGIIYINKPTPSGCDRWLLDKSTTEGYQTYNTAALIMNKDFPDYVQIEICDDIQDEPIDELLKSLKSGMRLTLITPKNKIELAHIEVTEYDNPNLPKLNIDITIGQLKMLLYKKTIEFTETSGDAPNLSYIYDYYRVI